MPSTPLICCSIGVATVSATVLAFAPGKAALTMTVGGAISGYCEIGNDTIEMMPTTTVTIEIALAKTGRSMKNNANFMVSFSRPVERSGAGLGHVRERPRDLRWLTDRI